MLCNLQDRKVLMNSEQLAIFALRVIVPFFFFPPTEEVQLETSCRQGVSVSLCHWQCFAIDQLQLSLVNGYMSW